MTHPRLHQPDYWIVALTFFLIAFGLVMLASAGAVVGYERFGESSYFFKQQFFNFAIGLFAMLITVLVDYHRWRSLALPFLIASIMLLVAVLVPGVGFAAGGATRWIHLGFFLLQPSELAKLTFLLYLAVWLERRGSGAHSFTYGFLPFLVLLGVIITLVMFQPDLGTVSIVTLMSVLVYFVSGAPWRHLLTMVAAGVGLLALLIKLAPYRVERITVFLNPQIDPQGIGYHINQALLAIGSGGLFGVGLGRSQQKFNVLPEVTSDSIFAVIAEELGFIIVVALIALFVVFLRRGLSVARRAPDPFGRSLAAGVSIWVVFQALINIGALSGLLPLTGITLPFISAGGSSLITMMAAVGMLINVSRQTKT